MAILRSAFLGKRRMQPFVHLLCSGYIWHCSTGAESHWISFHTSGGISRPAAFLFLVFVCTMLSSSWINCSSLISCWLLIIFVIGFLRKFPSRFSKCSFYMCICSSWLWQPPGQCLVKSASSLCQPHPCA